MELFNVHNYSYSQFHRKFKQEFSSSKICFRSIINKYCKDQWLNKSVIIIIS